MRKIIGIISILFLCVTVNSVHAQALTQQLWGGELNLNVTNVSVNKDNTLGLGNAENIDGETVLMSELPSKHTTEAIRMPWHYQPVYTRNAEFSPLVKLTSEYLPKSVLGNQRFFTPRDPNRDTRKRFFWGIAFAATNAKMKIELDPSFWYRTDSIQSIRPIGQVGGGFGGSVAMRMGKYWELKMLTMLQLHQRNLQYTWQHTPGPNIKIETISMDIPITLKYRSSMPNNTRMYVLGGLRYSHDFQSNEDVPIGDTKPLVAIKKNTYYYEIGAGFEFRLDFVDLSIEFKLSNGINNALVRVPNSYYSGSLRAIYPRLFSISLMAQD